MSALPFAEKYILFVFKLKKALHLLSNGNQISEMNTIEYWELSTECKLRKPIFKSFIIYVITQFNNKHKNGLL